MFILLGSNLIAQVDDSTSLQIQDTLQAPKIKAIKLALDFDKRFSFINNSDVNIWGFRLGVSVNNKYKVGIGGYFLSQKSSGIILDATGVPINQLTKNLYIGTIYFEPYLFRRKRWEMGMIFEVGYGKAELDSSNKIRGRFLTTSEKQDFVAAGMGYSVLFLLPDIKGLHFLSYFGLNGITGLRKTVFNSDLQYNYDGWYWSAGVKVFIDKIFRDISGKNKKVSIAN
jgi:hypothetical protein